MKIPEILPRIYKYCAYQDRSRKEIVEKLISLDVMESDIPAILENLKQERMWDEARYARSFVRGKFTVKRWGRNKIRYELKKKGLQESMIETALSSEIEAEDYFNTLQLLTERKLKQWDSKSSVERRQKVIRFLNQKGYEWELIMQALPRV